MDKAKSTAAGIPQITVSKFDISTYCECGGEYNMPDYYPAIRKIVSCSAEALPDTKFLSGNVLEYGGTLAFTIIYIGEDGALVSLPYTCEYSGNHPLPAEVRGTAEVSVDVCADDIQYRVLAPRKLSLRSKIRARISANDAVFCELEITDHNDSPADRSSQAKVQLLKRDIPVMSTGRGTTTGNVSGEFSEKAGTKPVSCSAAINITEVSCRKNAVLVKGDAVLRCLMFTHDGYYAPTKARFPFEETINADGAAEGDMCRAWGRAASVSVMEEGDGRFKAEIEYDLDSEWCRKGNVTVIDDAYCINRDSDAERCEISSKSPICCTFTPLSINGNGKRTTKPENGEYLIDTRCSATIEKVEQKDDRVIFTGNCAFKAYIAANGEVICEEFSLPLKYEASASGEALEGNIIFFQNVCSTDCSGRLDGDGIAVNAELCLSVCAIRETKIFPLVKLKLNKTEKAANTSPAIKVFYPDAGESLWDISKKYLAPIEALEKINSINRKDNTDGKPILIPCGLS